VLTFMHGEKWRDRLGMFLPPAFLYPPRPMQRHVRSAGLPTSSRTEQSVASRAR
jgi:hypothetical protein